MVEKKSEHEKVATSPETIRSRYWNAQVQRAIRGLERYRDRGDAVIDVYRGNAGGDLESYAILWANTEVLRPAMYSHTPRPQVERRHLENDVVGDVAALVLERSLVYCQHLPGKEFDDAMMDVRDDALLPGRGVSRIRYEAEFDMEEQTIQVEGEDGEPKLEVSEVEVKVSEAVWAEYVYWKDFLFSPAARWDDVWWVAFASNMTREELVEAFGESVGRAVPLSGSLYDKSKYYDEDGTFDYASAISDEKDEGFARVWEIWDKRDRKVRVVAEGYEKIIDEYDDPYEIEGFFPMARPLDVIRTTGSLIPIPEYAMYQFQAEELNILSRRISALTDGLKARGVADAQIRSLQSLFDGEDNEIIPDEEFGKILAAGGMKGVIAWAPITEIASVLQTLQPRRRETLNIIYELTGISDIMRGSTDPRETATAIVKKGQWGSMRVREKQKAMQKYCRDTLRIMAEVMCNLFDMETFVLMAGVADDMQVMQGMEMAYQRLQDDKLRDYSVSIETDSTIAVNEAERKEDTAQFFTSISALMKELMPAAQQGILPMEVAKQLLMYAAKQFDAGRDLQGALEQIGSQPPQQGQEQQGQDQGAQAQAQAAVQVAQMQMQVEQMKIEQKREEAQIDAQLKQAELQLKAAELAQQARSDDADRQLKLATELINIQVVRENRAGGENVQ